MTLSWWCLSDSLCLCWFAGQPPRSYPAETSSVPPGRQGPPAAPQVGVYHNRLAYQTLYVLVFDVVKQHDLLSWIHSCFCCLGSCPFLKGSPTSTRGVTSANSWINGRRYLSGIWHTAKWIHICGQNSNIFRISSSSYVITITLPNWKKTLPPLTSGFCIMGMMRKKWDVSLLSNFRHQLQK